MYLSIIGLDPAGPQYEDFDIMAGVNPTSATFVDIIHTDGESLIYPYGQMRPLGHMDFYPNGGDTQPGCITYYSSEHESKCLFKLEGYLEGTSTVAAPWENIKI